MADIKDQTSDPEKPESATNVQLAASDTSKTSDDTPTDQSLKEGHDVEPPKPADLEAGQDVEKKEEDKEKSSIKPRSKLKIALIMLSLCIAVFLAALDTTIITTAVPTIAERFEVSEADYAWIGSTYLLAAAASGPTWGKFSDIWGRKPVLLLANLVFLVASLIAALSIDVKMLLAGRVIQGIGGGGLIILSNICVGDLFSQRDRGKFYGMIGGVWGLASALGPVLGGVFAEKVSWRWCFYINLPFDGIAFIIIFFFLDIEIPKTPWLAGLAAIDWVGVITISGGTVMFLLGLEYGGVSYPWTSATVICLIVFGLVTIALFFFNEWKFAKYPIMPLRLFKYRSNVACLVVCFVHGMVFISGAYYLPLYFQAVLGATPILSGVYLFPFVLSLSFTSIVGGVFIKKTGQYLPPIWLGMTFMAIGFGLYLDLPSTREWGRIFPFQIIAGIGVGPIFQAPLIALQTHVQPRDIATATSLFGFVRNIATSVSVVIGGVIFQNRMMAHGGALRSVLPPDLAMELGGGNAGSSTGLVRSLSPSQKRIVQVSYNESLRTLWIFYVAIAAVGVLASFGIQRKVLSKQHVEYKSGLAQEEKNRAAQNAEDAVKKELKEERRRSRRSQDLSTALDGKDGKRRSRKSQDLSTAVEKQEEERGKEKAGELGASGGAVEGAKAEGGT